MYWAAWPPRNIIHFFKKHIYLFHSNYISSKGFPLALLVGKPLPISHQRTDLKLNAGGHPFAFEPRCILSHALDPSPCLHDDDTALKHCEEDALSNNTENCAE
jgi:hypothetical protein